MLNIYIPSDSVTEGTTSMLTDTPHENSIGANSSDGELVAPPTPKDQMDDDSNTAKVTTTAVPFVDKVAETGIFSALSTIKPISMRNSTQSQSTPQDSSSKQTNEKSEKAEKADKGDKKGSSSTAKTEMELFEP